MASGGYDLRSKVNVENEDVDPDDSASQTAPNEDVDPEDSASQTAPRPEASSSQQAPPSSKSPQPVINKTYFTDQRTDRRDSTSVQEESVLSSLLIEEERKSKLRALKRMEQIKIEKIRLQTQEEELAILSELEMAEARTRALTRMETPPPPVSLPERMEPPSVNIAARSFVPTGSPPVTANTTTSLRSEPQSAAIPASESASGDLIASIVKQLKKPQFDIEKFSGDPMKYKRFMRQFKSNVVPHTESSEEQLNYLELYTSGKPQRIVRGYGNLDPEVGLRGAIEELEEIYGDPEIIAHAYINEALEWPVMKNDNLKLLEEFSLHLTECKNALNSMEEMKILEYKENLKRLVQKLPYQLQERWRSVVYEIKERKQSLTFGNLVAFVRKECKKNRDPTFGKEVLKPEASYSSYSHGHKKSDNQKPQYHKQRLTLAATSPSYAPRERYKSSSPPTSKSCLYCNNKSHNLEHCGELRRKPIEDRLTFLKDKDLCFGCLINGHRSKHCQKRKQCDHCMRRHPSVLHDDNQQKTYPLNQGQTPVTSSFCSQFSRSQESTVISPSQESTVISPSQESTVISPSQESTVISPSQESTVISPSQESTVISPSQEPTVISPSQESTVISPSQESTVISPSQESTVISPSQESTVISPSQESTVISLNQESTVSTPTVISPSQESTVSTPNRQMSNPVKVQEDEDVRISSQFVESSSQNQLDPSSQQLVEEDFSNEHAGAGNEEDCRMAIVPVIARNRRTSARKETYAFHDTGSSITFITEQLIKELGLKGKKMKLTILTMGVPLIMVTEMITDLEILGLDRQYAVVIPVAYSKEQMPVTSRHIPTEEDIRCWPHLRNIKMPKIEADVGILIGNNVSDAYSPFEVITGPSGSPHATRTRLGWIFWCVKRRSKGDKHMVNKAEIMAVEELETLNGLKEMVKSSINLDFPEHLADEKRECSLQDKLFIQKTQNSITFVDQHYQVALPFKYDVKLPNNRPLAEQRLRSLQRKMFKSETYREDYIKFMNNMLDKDYASLVPKEDLDRQDGRVWFVPHHGTYKKPDKIRIVFDCSSVYQGISLNKLLLPGPDLTNTLLGVLLRFRLEPVAIMGDVEAMFHQVRIPPSDMDFLRFLWWPEGNADLPAESYRMKVHLFGAVSSPSCANTALRKTAEDHEQEYPDEIINCILRNFYVDDLLKSVPTEAEAIFIYNNLTELLAKGGFKLTKWVSNRRTVIEAISVEDRANNVKNINLDKENLPSDRALGVFWSIEEDCFEFKVNIPERCFTRRSILSFVCSIFDPIGLISPFILPAKCILQNLCQHGFSWDDPIDEVNLKKWEKWLTDISGIKEFKTPRCIKPEHFGELKLRELHCFSDSSNYGYGCCIYLRLVNQQAAVHCSLILGKSRVSPLKKIIIPRMELMAATMSLKISQVILREIDVPIDRVHYWTDSMSVIRYINNDSTRFHTFVANRLSVIHQCSNPSQWHYCKSEDNPSDLASRGISTKDQSKIEFWLNGPEFLLQTTKEWPVSDVLKDCAELSAEDPEVKISQCAVIKAETAMDQLINHYSDWFKVKKAVAWWKQFMCLFKVWVRRRKKLKEDKLDQDQINREIDNGRRKDLNMLKLKVSDIEDAELDIIKHVQHLHFSEEIESIRNGTAVKKNSPIRRLDPIIENGLLLVGGRLNRAKLPYTAKHPVILPKCTQASKLILEQFHKINGHLGRNSMLSDLRQKYWILSANSAVRSLVRNCVICRRYQSKVCEQKMSNLPSDRLIAGEKAFTRTGMDFFGPFIVRRGRTDHKRYGVVFTCLATRAVHLEVAHTLDTDSCINAIRRCMARRGRISVLRCDNGTNLIGAQRELKAEIDKWNQSVIHQTMLQENIKFEFSPPTGSHFGGIWERIIRTVRKILYSLLQEQSIKLDDESLQTLFCEIEYIINRRPITHVSSDPKDLEALTPSHLLLSFSGQYLPPGVFDKKDCFVRRKWKQIQYISDVFWRRWQKEYLPLLQERQKWFNPKRNVKVGDLVLVVDNTLPRNSWLLGRVVEVKPDNKGLVRIVRVKTKSSEIDRPVDKLVLILEADT